MGLAIKIDEYVPTMMPTVRASEKSRIILPPINSMQVVIIKTVSDVSIVRENV